MEKNRIGWAGNFAESLESPAIVKIKPRYDFFIDGNWHKPVEGRYFSSLNPATEEPLTEVAEGTEKDVDRAVKSARNCYTHTWSKMKGQERGRYLFRIARMIQERSRDLAVAESLDGGKPIKESRDIDVPLAAAHFFYYAGWSDKLDYAFSGKLVHPLGVVAQIIPWNFPLLMAAWKLAPALACGNCVVLKPAETTSLTALMLAEIMEEAELPPGAVNIITGAGSTGAYLVAHSDINKVAFTGSTEVGKMIAKNLSDRAVKLTLELGGKSANIVFEDAAIDQAVEGVINGIFFNQGHVCCAGSRLLLEESIADVFIEKLKHRMAKIRVGNPLDKNTDLGAINSKEQWSNIHEMIESGRREGGHIFQTKSPLPPKGFFHLPTLIESVSSSATVYREEIFGPVIVVNTFRTPSEAIVKANDSRYGLAAGIWTEKGSKAMEVARQLKAGIVWINSYNKFDPGSPFGGYLESGWGREGGRHGLFPYLELK